MNTSPNTVLMVVHQRTSVTGRIGERLRERGLREDIRCPMEGHRLPESLDDFAGSMVFGGPMSANDEHLDGIRVELDWLDVMLAAEKPFLGICLGAQMLARTLGHKVEPHPEGYAEIGYYPLQATAEGQALFGDETLHAYQWHRCLQS